MISTHSPAHTHSAFFPVTIHRPSVLPTKAVPSLVHWIPPPLKFPQSFKPPLSPLFHWVILDHSKQHKFMPFSLLFKNKTNKMYKWGFPGGTVDKNLHAKEERQVPSPVQEDSICHAEQLSPCHNHWARALETESHNYWRLYASTREAAARRSPPLLWSMAPTWLN